MVKIVVDGVEIETEREDQHAFKGVLATPEPDGWISVEDELPPDKHEVLYFAINENQTSEIMTGHREKGIWTHCCLFYSTMYLNADVKVTHWMELPHYPRNVTRPVSLAQPGI